MAPINSRLTLFPLTQSDSYPDTDAQFIQDADALGKSSDLIHAQATLLRAFGTEAASLPPGIHPHVVVALPAHYRILRQAPYALTRQRI